LERLFFEFIRVETGKGEVGGFPHMYIVKSILFSDIKSFTKKTPFLQHILFIHILPPIFIKGFNHMGWLKTC
jgi:hypothetical protein